MFVRTMFIFFSCTVLGQLSNEHGYCEKLETCTNRRLEKNLFYDVNPPEGFNLRRDVYMRFAIMLAEAQRKGQKTEWTLVLPPWYRLFHWKSDLTNSKPVPWSLFFDIESLKSYAPVKELNDIFVSVKPNNLKLDRMYILQNYEDAFEDGVFIEKWEINKEVCRYDGGFWGYDNITVKEVVCVKFQGKASKLWEVLSLHHDDNNVMFAHAEIALHDSYGTKEYWNCRKSMKFNKELIEIANKYIQNNFGCTTPKCSSYVSIHLRRQDFARSRRKDVPSINSAALQLNKMVQSFNSSIKNVFVATDASGSELEQLQGKLEKNNYNVYYFTPSDTEIKKYRDGGIAIIDQIICSHSAYFIGTHESTFSFRIQEEREILGFPSSTTFNRLCPDSGLCARPSKWTIVN